MGGEVHRTSALLPGNTPRYPLNMRLGGPQGRSARLGVKGNLLLVPEIETRFIDDAVV